MISSVEFFVFKKRKHSQIKLLLTIGTGLITINNKAINIYFFNNLYILTKIKYLYTLLSSVKNYNISILVSGGGLSSQSTAILYGLGYLFSTYFLPFDPIFKNLGFLNRDLRIKERKKYGLRKARKAGQYSKR